MEFSQVKKKGLAFTGQHLLPFGNWELMAPIGKANEYLHPRLPKGTEGSGLWPASTSWVNKSPHSEEERIHLSILLLWLNKKGIKVD